MSFRSLDRLLGGVAGPGHGEVAGEQPDLAGFGFQAAGEHVAGVVLAVVPVAEPVGDLAPVHRLVIALAQAGEQFRVELGAAGGDRLLNCAMRLAQDLANLLRPVLPVRVQGVHPP